MLPTILNYENNTKRKCKTITTECKIIILECSTMSIKLKKKNVYAIIQRFRQSAALEVKLWTSMASNSSHNVTIFLLHLCYPIRTETLRS